MSMASLRVMESFLQRFITTVYCNAVPADDIGAARLFHEFLVVRCVAEDAPQGLPAAGRSTAACPAQIILQDLKT